MNVHIHIAEITTIITYDLLLSGLVARSVEPRSSVGRATVGQIQIRFPPRSKIFSLPRALSHFLTWANAQWEIHGFT